MGQTAEQKRTKMREWNELNRDHIREYRRKHAEERRRRQRERYAADAAYRDKCKASVKKDRESNPIKIRNRKLVSAYGITLGDAEDLYSIQAGRCVICQCELVQHGVNGTHIDHDHSTPPATIPSRSSPT